MYKASRENESEAYCIVALYFSKLNIAMMNDKQIVSILVPHTFLPGFTRFFAEATTSAVLMHPKVLQRF